MTPFTPPAHAKTAFNCPSCGAFANQQWWEMLRFRTETNNYGQTYQDLGAPFIELMSSLCTHCAKDSLWLNGRMIYPLGAGAPLPNPDMPDDVRQDYEEARAILSISPRGAAALLRLAVQRLCKHLGQPGENINADIAALVSNGLPPKLQQALDSVRVIGNNAVHPGQLDIFDTAEVATKLFVFLNVIIDNQITQPRTID